MRILFLGAPGAGKGTQCKKLAEKLDLVHLSSGDLLREAVKNGTPAGLEAKEYMDKGNLVPDPVLIAMFRDKLSRPEMKKGFLLDGFPRNLAQAESLDSMLDEIGSPLTSVVNLHTPDELLLERITGRRTCPNKACNAVYHVKFSPPAREGVCDNCNEALVQRSDDKAEVVDQRLANYRQLTEPLIDYYSRKGLVQTVDGVGEPDNVFDAILSALKNAQRA